MKEVVITLDTRTRQAYILFTAKTDQETIKEVVTITCQTME